MHWPGRHSKLWGAALLCSAGALGSALMLPSAAPAAAHIEIASDSYHAGDEAVLSISVPHGCGASPTTRIAIKIPADINYVVPTRNSFYTLELVPETLQAEISDTHGNSAIERVSEVIYTAITPLPHNQRDTFQLAVRIPETAAGHTLYFPTLQSCGSAESAWVQIPAVGQEAAQLQFPAPAIVVSSPARASTAVTATASHQHSGDVAPVTLLALGLVAVGVGGAVVALWRVRQRS